MVSELFFTEATLGRSTCLRSMPVNPTKSDKRVSESGRSAAMIY